jgi:hypothetical protein
VADIGDRATLTPGTHPSVNTGGTPAAHAARQQQLGFSFDTLGTVLFDSFAMMYGLPQASTASDKISISFWISPDGPAQGAILSSPFMSFKAIADHGAGGSIISTDYSVYEFFNPIAGAGIAEAYAPDTTPNHWAFLRSIAATGPVIPLGFESIIQCGAQLETIPTFYQIADTNYDRGSTGKFYHVMISVHATGGRPKLTIAVNDTVLVADQNCGSDLSSVITNEPWLFPYGSTTASSGTVYPAMRNDAQQAVQPIIGGPNPWQIGGRLVDFPNEWDFSNGSGGLSAFPEGDGMWGAVTEVWIAQGQYVDWTNSANRNKFHSTDILGNVFLPVDLGANGALPTGTRPTMYFTGMPDKFIINRVTGQKATVYKGTRNSLTLDYRYPGAL